MEERSFSIECFKICIANKSHAHYIWGISSIYRLSSTVSISYRRVVSIIVSTAPRGGGDEKGRGRKGTWCKIAYSIFIPPIRWTWPVKRISIRSSLTANRVLMLGYSVYQGTAESFQPPGQSIHSNSVTNPGMFEFDIEQNRFIQIQSKQIRSESWCT